MFNAESAKVVARAMEQPARAAGMWKVPPTARSGDVMEPDGERRGVGATAPSRSRTSRPRSFKFVTWLRERALARPERAAARSERAVERQLRHSGGFSQRWRH